MKTKPLMILATRLSALAFILLVFVSAKAPALHHDYATEPKNQQLNDKVLGLYQALHPRQIWAIEARKDGKPL